MERFSVLLLFPTVMVAQSAPVVRGPGGGSDLFFIVAHPQDPDILFVGGDIEGIFRSLDGGATWSNVSASLSASGLGRNVYFIQDILVDMATGDVYLATGAGLFVSRDTGATWNLLWKRATDPSGEEYASVGVVALRPTQPAEIWMGLGDRITHSAQTDFTPWPAYDFPVGVFRSLDGGQTWDSLPVPLDSASVHSIVFLGPDTVLVATSNGLFRSVDGGASWVSLSGGLPHTQINILVSANGNPDVLFLSLHTLGTSGNPGSFQGGIFRSTDAGDTWTDITGNLPRYMPSADLFYEYWQLFPQPGAPETLWVGTTRGSGWDSSGLWMTASALASSPVWDWIYAPATTGWMDAAWFPDPYVRGIAIPPLTADRIYLTHVYVEMSPDRGNSWVSAYTTPVGGAWRTTGLECGNADALAFHPSDTLILWAGYDDFGLFRSEDGGVSFFRLDPSQNPPWPYSTGDGVRQILVDPAAPQNLYVTRWTGSLAAGPGCGVMCYDDGGILFSTDGGNTFTDLMTSPMPNQSPWLAVDFTTGSPGNRRLWVAIFGDGVYRSTDNGATWTRVLNEPRAWLVAVHPASPDTLFLALNLAVHGGSTLLLRSTDGGDTWASLALPVTPTGSDALTDLRITPSGAVFVVYEDIYRWPYFSAVYRSDDGGATWSPLFTHTLPLVMDVHPLQPDLVAVGVASSFRGHVGELSGRLVLSRDGGLTWTDLPVSLPHHGFNFLRFHPVKPGLYVGTGGNGVREIPGIPIGVTENLEIRLPALRWSRQGLRVEACGSSTVLEFLDAAGRILARKPCRAGVLLTFPARGVMFVRGDRASRAFKTVHIR